MTRDVRWYLLGSLILVSLAGCGRNFFAEREAWRHEAEVQCLKSGVIKEGPGVALLSPISGPGICGADFPLKVAALGSATDSALGYTDTPVRPPGSVGAPRSRSSSYPSPRSDSRTSDTASTGTTSSDSSDIDEELLARQQLEPTVRSSPPRAASSSSYPPSFPANGEIVPVAPAQAAAPATAVAVAPAATLACPVVSTLDRWVTEGIQPAAIRWFGQPVVQIKQISAYSCRGMNGNPRAHISEHAFGNALDIAAFTLADNRVVTVRTGWHGAPEEQGFLRDVQTAACEMFSTVLAPGSNRFHYDHIHVDLMRRNSGRRICQPEAVPGEAVAARARAKSGYASRRPSDYAVTGSVTSRRSRAHPSRLPDARFRGDRDEPAAVPGED